MGQTEVSGTGGDSGETGGWTQRETSQGGVGDTHSLYFPGQVSPLIGEDGVVGEGGTPGRVRTCQNLWGSCKDGNRTRTYWGEGGRWFPKKK